MEQHTTQVVIIGAGPSGLSMAAQLLRYGIDFVIIEKNRKTTHLSKAVVVQARTLEIFQEFGIAQKAIETGRITTAFSMYYNGVKRATLDLAGMGDGQSAFPFVLSLEQSKTEKLLLDYLSENGKTVLWNSEFIRFEQNGGVTVFYKDVKDIEQTIKANYIIGADGTGSLVRHQMNAGFQGDTIPKIFYVADAELNSTVVNKDELFIFLIKKGFVLFFPMEGQKHYRVIGILPDKTEEDEFTFEDIQDSIKQDIKIPIVFNKINWFSSYKVHSRKANSFMDNRCLIIGDAAHIHTPAGGQGMNTGIQDAYNLAWKLAYKLKYRVSQSVVESYNTERTENARHLLNTTDRMFDFMTGANAFWNFVRLNVFPFFMRFVSKTPMLNKRMFLLLSQIGIAYPNSKLTVKSQIGKVKAGDRMPYFTFSDGTAVYDYISEPAFKILFFGSQAHNVEQQLEHLKFKVIPLSFPEVPKAVFGNAVNFYILLRPDSHISYLGNDFNKCRKLLDRISNSR
jgi:2-polyprenyl-6-methoxyphenol hydroxylase-like FAD-dependent oxidoreductase